MPHRSARSRSITAKRGKITPPSRPVWTGTIRLSLVSIPVNVFTGLDREGDTHFHQIHRQTGKRVRYQKMVPGVGPVEQADIVKGFEFEKGQYIVVEPDELKALKIESSDSFVIGRFVERSEIDSIYFNAPYFVAPAEEGAMAGFAVIRDALRAERKVGLGQIVLSGRERLACLQPCGKGMLLETLRYKDDLKATEPFFAPIKDVKAAKDEIDLARKLIEQKSGSFDPAAFEDHYDDAVRDLLEEKRKGKKIVSPEPEEDERKSAEIIDIMDALKRSLAGKAAPKKPAKPANDTAKPAPKRAKKAAGGRR